MIELFRTNNPVFISALTAALNAEGIASVVFDAHTSILEGSIGAIPRRVMVDGRDRFMAERILELIQAEAR